MAKSIYEELKACTVRIVYKNRENKYSVKGTGFFIEKNIILTCYHVINSDNLKVIWNNTEYEMKILEGKEDLDLILLKVDANNENSVEIDTKVSIHDKCYAFGFPNNKDENKVLAKELQSNEDGLTFKVVHITNNGLIKFKGEQFKEGFSGSPVLNEESKKVCSIISVSRDTDEIKGGYGISLKKLELLNYKEEQNKNEIIDRITLKNGTSFEIALVKVKLEDGKTLYVGKYPVTFEEYDLFCEDTKRCKKYEPNDRGWGRGKRPVINVSWNDAIAYCEWLNSYSNNKQPYSLPNSTDWLLVAEKNMPNLINSDIWYKKKETLQVDIGGRGELGIYHMYGNVYEWCNNKEFIGGYFESTSFDMMKKIQKGTSKHRNDRIGFRVVYNIV